MIGSTHRKLIRTSACKAVFLYLSSLPSDLSIHYITVTQWGTLQLSKPMFRCCPSKASCPCCWLVSYQSCHSLPAALGSSAGRGLTAPLVGSSDTPWVQMASPGTAEADVMNT